MTIRFHLSCDVSTGQWHLEAHDIRERKWFLIPEAIWDVQLDKLAGLGIHGEERARLEDLRAKGRSSAWLNATEVERTDLLRAGFILQSTVAAIPRRL